MRELRSIEGVRNTYPIVVSGASVKFENGKLAPVLIIGSESPVFVAGPKPETINEGSFFPLMMMKLCQPSFTTNPFLITP